MLSTFQTSTPAAASCYTNNPYHYHFPPTPIETQQFDSKPPAVLDGELLPVSRASVNLHLWLQKNVIFWCKTFLQDRTSLNLLFFLFLPIHLEQWHFGQPLKLRLIQEPFFFLWQKAREKKITISLLLCFVCLITALSWNFSLVVLDTESVVSQRLCNGSR